MANSVNRLGSGDELKRKQVGILQAEAQADTKEHSATFRKNMDENDAANLSPEIEQAIATLKPDLEKYLEAVDKTVTLAVKDKVQARAMVDQVHAAYKTLEDSMEKLSDLIVEAEKTSRDRVNATVGRAEKLLTIFLSVPTSTCLYGLRSGCSTSRPNSFLL